jgi:hypothetical protein
VESIAMLVALFVFTWLTLAVAKQRGYILQKSPAPVGKGAAVAPVTATPAPAK